MEISEDIRNTHRSLSLAGAKFLDFVQKEPEALRFGNFPGITAYDDGLVRLQPWPTFVSKQFNNQMEEASVGVCNLIKSLPKRLFSNDTAKIKDYYEVPEDHIEYSLLGCTDEHIRGLFGRGDFILSSSGMKCVEYNIASNIGGWQTPVWRDMYLQDPTIKRFIEEYDIKTVKDRDIMTVLLTLLIDNGIAKLSDGVEELNVAIVAEGRPQTGPADASEEYLARLYKDILESRYYGLSGEVIFCDYPHLNVKNNRLFLKEKRVRSLVEFYGGTVPMTILSAFMAGELLLYNGPFTTLTMSKLNIALLSENEDSPLFNNREQEIIKKHIPWTRKIRDIDTFYKGRKVGLLEFIRSNRADLVIKPGGGLGGVDVSVGRYLSQASWEKALEEGINKRNWLVQEYLETLPLLYQQGENGCTPHITVWGLFTFGDRFGDSFLRVLPTKDDSGVVNCKQGATVSVPIEVEE
ncbi:MAG: circularly permuted type 2 ATP-grasp protein [bacterium]|nr:circularly permuted type 2 ATP-grasp protein [bacterium]